MGLHHLEAFWTKAKGNSCCCGSRTKEVVSAGCRWVRPASWRRNGESSHKPLSEARSDSQRLEVGAQRLRSVLSSHLAMTLNKSFHFPKWKGMSLHGGPTWPCWVTRQNVNIISLFTFWRFRDPPKHNTHHCSSLSRADHQLGWVVQKSLVTALDAGSLDASLDALSPKLVVCSL